MTYFSIIYSLNPRAVKVEGPRECIRERGGREKGEFPQRKISPKRVFKRKRKN